MKLAFVRKLLLLLLCFACAGCVARFRYGEAAVELEVSADVLDKMGLTAEQQNNAALAEAYRSQAACLRKQAEELRSRPTQP